MLSEQARSYLRLARRSSRLYIMAKADLTENIARSIDENLTANELVNVRFRKAHCSTLPKGVQANFRETLHAEIRRCNWAPLRALYRRARNLRM